MLSGNDSVTATGTGAKIQSDTLKCFKIVDEKLHWNDQALEVLCNNKMGITYKNSFRTV